MIFKKCILWPSFSLAFIIVGLPSLFVLRELIPINPKVLTYASMALILLLMVNYKNLVKLKIYTNISLMTNLILFLILSIFFINSLFIKGFNDQTMYLFIIFYIYLGMFTLKGNELDQFYYYLFSISSFTLIFAWIFTPTDASYWALNGGRFYVGDTHNPGLVSITAIINIFTGLFVVKKYKKKLVTLFYILMLFLSIYLFILSQTKSPLLGLVFMGTYLIYVTKSPIKQYIKYLIIAILLSIVVFNVFPEIIIRMFNALQYAIFDLLGLTSSHDVLTSGAVRNMNFKKSYDMFSITNHFGYGINTFRMDSPFLQTALDLGNIIAVLFIYVGLIYPLYLISKYNFNQIDINAKVAILIYLFFLPNLFFHGTPYDYSIWVPILTLHKVLTSTKARNESI